MKDIFKDFMIAAKYCLLFIPGTTNIPRHEEIALGVITWGAAIMVLFGLIGMIKACL